MNFANEVIKIGQPAEHTVEVPIIFKETKPEIIEPEKTIDEFDEFFDSKEFKKFSEAEKRKGINILKQAGAKLNEFPFLNTPAKKAIIAIIAIFLSLGAVATAITFTVDYINNIVYNNNFNERIKIVRENWEKLPQELKDKMNLLTMDDEKWKALSQEEQDKINKEVDEIYFKYLDPNKP